MPSDNAEHPEISQEAARQMLAALKEARHALRWLVGNPSLPLSDRASAQAALSDVCDAIGASIVEAR